MGRWKWPAVVAAAVAVVAAGTVLSVARAQQGYWGELVAFKAASGQYVTVEPSGNVVVNRWAQGPWEQFYYINMGHADSTHTPYMLVAVSNHRCFSFEPGGHVVANRSYARAWEEMAIGLPWVGTGTQDIMAFNKSAPYGSWYVAAENGGGSVLHANRVVRGPWEEFHVVHFGSPTYYPGPGDCVPG
jgi:hypothetical protein